MDRDFAFHASDSLRYGGGLGWNWRRRGLRRSYRHPASLRARIAAIARGSKAAAHPRAYTEPRQRGLVRSKTHLKYRVIASGSPIQMAKFAIRAF